jgi:hypothetical protein
MASQPTGIHVLAFAAAPAMGDGAPAEGDAPTKDDRDDSDDEVEHFVWGGSDDAQRKMTTKTQTMRSNISFRVVWKRHNKKLK